MDSLYTECAKSLFALALKEKNIRSKKYLLEQATAMDNFQNEMEVAIHLYNHFAMKRLQRNQTVQSKGLNG
jgi:hypothetical protein